MKQRILLPLLVVGTLLCSCHKPDVERVEYKQIDSVWVHKRGTNTLQFENVYYFLVNGEVHATRRKVNVGDYVQYNYIRK